MTDSYTPAPWFVDAGNPRDIGAGADPPRYVAHCVTPGDAAEIVRCFNAVHPIAPGGRSQRLRLWRTNYSGSAYKDQTGRAHDGHIVYDEVDVTIVERKPAIGIWGRKPTEGMAVRAVDAASKEYFCNWDGSFADDSPTPMWMWYDKWEMATTGSIFPCFYPDGRIANPKVDEPGLKTLAVDMAKGPDGFARVLYFMGRPVADMTREELLGVIKSLASGESQETSGREEVNP
jgi:hypothetical protein